MADTPNSPAPPPVDDSSVPSSIPSLDLGAPRAEVTQEFDRIVERDPTTNLDTVRQQANKETSDRADETTKTYAPQDQARDTTRQIITLWLIGLFCAIVALSFVALFVIGLKSGFDGDFFEKLKRLLDVLLGPVLTLLSSAIGFYFGYQQGSTTLKNSTAASTNVPASPAPGALK